MQPQSTIDRFWAKVRIGMDGCWCWAGARNPNGYGQFSLPGRKRVVAHRFSFELACGPVPDDRELDHLCRNRACVNPAHLEVVTHSENLLRAEHYDRHKALCKNGHQMAGDNLLIRDTKRGREHCCRTCHREAQARYRQRKRARTVLEAAFNTPPPTTQEARTDG